jgi:hypothetical protein
MTANADRLPPVRPQSAEALARYMAASWAALEVAHGTVRTEDLALVGRLLHGTPWRVERDPATGRWQALRTEGPR